MKRHLVAVCLFGVIVADGRLVRAQESVDLLLHSGKIFTADERLLTFSSVVARDGRIVALGWDALRDQHCAERRIDLGTDWSCQGLSTRIFK